jgi:hypothetical protein
MATQPGIGSQPAPPSGAPAGGQPAAGGTEQSVPYARFKEVNDALKAYKDIGFSAEEVQEALVALAAFVEQAQAAGSGDGANAGNGGTQPNANGNTNGQWTQKQWEEWALQTFPWMREMKQAHEAQRESQQSTNQWRVTQAQERLKALATKAGYSEDKLKQLEDIVAALIRSDAGMKAAWDNGDLSVVEQAFKAHQTGFVEPVARNYATSVSGRKAANKAELAPKVAGGGSPAPAAPAKPKTIEEAHGAAMDKLAETGSELPEGEDEIVQE